MQERIQLTISENKDAVILQAQSDKDNCVTETRLSAQELLSLIERLGEAHAAITEAKTPPLKQAQSIKTVFNPIWRVESVLLGSAVMFGFYHPGYGALGFTLTNDQVSHMMGVLSQQIEEDIESLPKTAS